MTQHFETPGADRADRDPAATEHRATDAEARAGLADRAAERLSAELRRYGRRIDELGTTLAAQAAADRRERQAAAAHSAPSEPGPSDNSPWHGRSSATGLTLIVAGHATDPGLADTSIPGGWPMVNHGKGWEVDRGPHRVPYSPHPHIPTPTEGSG
ncbi:hypothetical protein F7Q99_27195 [Streptomyces kaniharaensis]|uniref:Uncharacterized protein n=1 Tax=Streptomyces kaniharaensis TaxID=212423 RepID=A0A6N7KW37_9ACTN|nr:hypothetical protein [Streptomyces kaniharaensis]MQS15852.1 hypothetical protein [Streptomyces kaniharaensis]